MLQKTRKDHALERISNNLGSLKDNVKKLSFNFRYFTYGPSYGESFDDWQKDNILADLDNKLISYSNKTRVELQTDDILKTYKHFPPDSKFCMPPALSELNVTWARMNLTGRRRLIGVFINGQTEMFDKDIFYIVFIDKEHQFAPYHKKS